MKRYLQGLALAPLALLGACAVQPAYQRPPLKVAEDAWSTASRLPSEPTALEHDGWWSLLGDPAIDPLVAAGLADNPTLADAAAQSGSVARGADHPERGAASRRRGRCKPLAIARPRWRRDDQRVVGIGRSQPLVGTRPLGPPPARRGGGSEPLGWRHRRRRSGAPVQYRRDRRHHARRARLRPCSGNPRPRHRLARGRDDHHPRAPWRGSPRARRPGDRREQSFVGARRPRRPGGGLPPPGSRVVGADRIGHRDHSTTARPAGLNPNRPAPEFTPALPASVLLAHPLVIAAERESAARWSEIAVARADRLPRIDLAAALSQQ